MQILSINSQYNSPNFGIKYVKPRSWNADVLDALMKSDLAKQIDNKYPKAKATYSSFVSFSMGKGLELLDIQLDKITKLKFRSEMDSELIHKITIANLKDIEEEMLDTKNEKISRKQLSESIYKDAEESNRRLSCGQNTGLIGKIISIFK